MKNIIIAYEPVWAIGTGLTATPDQAQEMHQYIRGLVKEQYGSKITDELTIHYGGSCKPSNAAEIFSKQDVDGGLIGGASLKKEDFIAIVEAV
jgi:triosephosphate isomerase